MKHYDVVISGCGPVGATLANLLARQGLSVRVIERVEAIYDKPRAIALDWEAMRTLQFAGVAHDLFPGTKPHPGTDYLGVDGGLIKLFDPAPPPYSLGWPATLTFLQPELERLLRAKLATRSTAEASYGWHLDHFVDLGSQVEISIKDDSDKCESMTASYLAGCDGASSLIRDRLGMGLEDQRFDEWWVVVDAHQKRETPLPKKTTQYCWPARPATFVVGPGNLKRWEIKILPTENPADFRDEETLKAVLSNFVDLDAIDIWRHAVYRFHALVGREWRRGRILLAGDSVHQMPPFLGQGLCAGLRDVSNLAWKIALTVRERASEHLLDTYEEERKSHVSAVIAHAKEFGLIIGELDHGRATERDERLRSQLNDGSMITSRQGFIPDLTEGLIRASDPCSGTLFVQPSVLGGDTIKMMDDVVPMEFLFVTVGLEPQGWLDEFAQLWAGLGGTRAALVSNTSQKTSQKEILVLREVDELFARWAEGSRNVAFIVRPDRYVYAGVSTKDELRAAIEELVGHLGLQSQPIRARYDGSKTTSI